MIGQTGVAGCLRQPLHMLVCAVLRCSSGATNKHRHCVLSSVWHGVRVLDMVGMSYDDMVADPVWDSVNQARAKQ